jgi:hypothetical protein
MSSSFVRKGISSLELFYGYKVPNVFGKLVLSLSHLQRSDLSTYSYLINEVTCLDSLRKFIDALLANDTYFECLTKEILNNRHLLETYQMYADKDGNIKLPDIINSFKSILINLRDSKSVNELVIHIFTLAEKLGRDFCKDESSFDSCQNFLKLYIAAEDNLRSLGVRQLS